MAKLTRCNSRCGRLVEVPDDRPYWDGKYHCLGIASGGVLVEVTDPAVVAAYALGGLEAARKLLAWPGRR